MFVLLMFLKTFLLFYLFMSLNNKFVLVVCFYVYKCFVILLVMSYKYLVGSTIFYNYLLKASVIVVV